MPLRRGHSNETISDNVRRLMHEGHSAKRAVAIALSHARKSSNKRRRTRKSLFISADAKLIKADKGKKKSKKRVALTEPRYPLGDKFFEALDRQLQKPKEGSKVKSKRTITQRQHDINFLKNTPFLSHFKSRESRKKYHQVIARLDEVAPKLPRRLPHGGISSKAAAEWQNFVDTLSGSKGTAKSRAIALGRGNIDLLRNEKPLEFDAKKYLERKRYVSPSAQEKAKKEALKEFYRIKGHHSQHTPATSKESKELQAKLPSGKVHTLAKPKALKQRALARKGELTDLPEKPTGWVGDVKSFLDLFRDTEGATKIKATKSLFISADAKLIKADKKETSTPAIGYTYGPGEKKAEELKTHLTTQAKKIKEFESPIISGSRTIRRKYPKELVPFNKWMQEKDPVESKPLILTEPEVSKPKASKVADAPVEALEDKTFRSKRPRRRKRSTEKFKTAAGVFSASKLDKIYGRGTAALFRKRNRLQEEYNRRYKAATTREERESLKINPMVSRLTMGIRRDLGLDAAERAVKNATSLRVSRIKRIKEADELPDVRRDTHKGRVYALKSRKPPKGLPANARAVFKGGKGDDKYQVQWVVPTDPRYPWKTSEDEYYWPKMRPSYKLPKPSSSKKARAKRERPPPLETQPGNKSIFISAQDRLRKSEPKGRSHINPRVAHIRKTWLNKIPKEYRESALSQLKLMDLGTAPVRDIFKLHLSDKDKAAYLKYQKSIMRSGESGRKLFPWEKEVFDPQAHPIGVGRNPELPKRGTKVKQPWRENPDTSKKENTLFDLLAGSYGSTKAQEMLGLSERKKHWISGGDRRKEALAALRKIAKTSFPTIKERKEAMYDALAGTASKIDSKSDVTKLKEQAAKGNLQGISEQPGSVLRGIRGVIDLWRDSGERIETIPRPVVRATKTAVKKLKSGNKSMFISAQDRLSKAYDPRKWLGGFKGVSGKGFDVKYDPSKVGIKELQGAQPQGTKWTYTKQGVMDQLQAFAQDTIDQAKAAKVTKPKVTKRKVRIEGHSGTVSGRRYLGKSPELMRSMFVSAEARLSKAFPPKEVKKEGETLQDVLNVALLRNRDGSFTSPANPEDLNKIYLGVLQGKLNVSDANLKALKLFNKIDKFSTVKLSRDEARKKFLAAVDPPKATKLAPELQALQIPKERQHFFQKPVGKKKPRKGYSLADRVKTLGSNKDFTTRLAQLVKPAVVPTKVIVKKKPKAKAKAKPVADLPASTPLPTNKSLFISSNTYFEKGAISEWPKVKEDLEEFVEMKVKPKLKTKKSLGLYVSSDAVLEKGKIWNWFRSLFDLNPKKSKPYKIWRRRMGKYHSAVDPDTKDPAKKKSPKAKSAVA